MEFPQSIDVTPTLRVDGTLDGNRSLSSSPQIAYADNLIRPGGDGGPVGNGTGLFEDFTAVTIGGSWRHGRWSASGRAEYRDGQFADRWGLSLNGIRQMGNGVLWGSRLVCTKARGGDGSSSAIIDAGLGFAYRPSASDFTMLGKLEYRSDAVRRAIRGGAMPVGRTAILVDGDALSRRLLASLSTNWSPQQGMLSGDEFRLFLGARYGFDQLDDLTIEGWTGLAGLDGRIGLGEIWQIGASGNLRANLSAGLTSYSFGPLVGVTPSEGVLLSLGYNVDGFYDPDFAAARNTNQGPWISMRMAFDESILSPFRVE